MAAAPQASQGGSSAQSASQGQGTGQGAGQAQGGDGGGDAGFDLQKAWHEARTARQETGKLKDTFTGFNKKLEGLDEDRDTLKRLKGAFAPEPKETKRDVIGSLQEQLDYYLESAIEMKAKGTSIPLTTNLAVQSFQTMIEQQEAIQALHQQIAELKGGLDKANNPEAPVNNMAYAQMETFMQSAIDGLYGNDQGSQGVKGQIYDATVRIIQANLTELQKQAPQEWDRVRRSPQSLQKIVNAAIKQLVPPRAYQILEKEQLQNTPMNQGELWAAAREAKQIQDPVKRQEVIAMIRRDILETQARDRAKRR